MKTTIYELLGMIKDNKAPRSVYYRVNMYTYDEASNDYWCNELDTGTKWLFDEYVITDILNDEVQILETTYKPYKIEKLDLSGYDDTDTGNFEEWTNEGIILAVKINEIIDKLNEE